jgi:hypothetical protein
MLCIGGVLLPAGSPARVSSTRKATSPFLYFHTSRFYLANWNENAKPFRWTKSAHQIKRSIRNAALIYGT